MTEEQYINYWKHQYKDSTYRNNIIKACKILLTEKLFDTNKMIELIKNSKDSIKEKQKAIKYLEGRESEK